MTNACIVLCMDASTSMSTNNNFQMAKTDASTFVYIMQTGDSLGVTGFSNTAWITYPTSSTAVTAITSQSIQDGASSAIMAMNMVGTTNISAGLTTSANMLTNAANPKAVILLSDGEWNTGPNPLSTLPSMPVYTIALGNNGQIQTLQQIASQTGGTFHLAPTPFDLADIYNEIIGQTQVATVVANQKQQVSQNRFWILPGTVAQGAPEATFSISWTNWAVTYTSNTPVGNQVNVTLQNPSGSTVPATPIAIGNGFAVFKIQNPAAGQWQVAIWTSAGGTLGTSCGIFDPQLNVQAEVQTPTTAVVGQPVPMTMRVREADGSVLSNVRITASLEAPSMNPEDAVARHRADLDAVAPAGAADISDNARMLELQMQRGPDDLLLPYNYSPLQTVNQGNGVHRLEFTPGCSGGHIVRLNINGQTSDRKRDFSLARRISVWVNRT
jgi:von Willebrand factor type A domain